MQQTSLKGELLICFLLSDCVWTLHSARKQLTGGGGGVDALAWQQASQASMYCLKYVRGLLVTYCTLLMDFRWMTNEMTDWRLTKMKAILYSVHEYIFAAF